RRSGWLWACVPVAVMLGTTAAPFAGEARPYGLVLGLSGLALVLWQAACGRGRGGTPFVVGLGCVLALLFSPPRCAVVFPVPLGCAELARAWPRRRLDVPVALALPPPLLVVAAYLPLIREARTYAPGFWARPSWRSLETESSQFLIGLGLALLGFLAVVGFFAPGPQERGEDKEEGYRPEERVLMAGLPVTPPPGVLLGVFGPGGFH